MFKVLIDNRATLNILLVSIFRKLGKKKYDILPTDLVMTKFYGTTTQPLGVISIKLIVDHRTTKTTFFVIHATTTYNALLEQDWIHASKCIPSLLYQYLIIWHNVGLAKVVKANVKPFVVTFNTADALLYIDDMGLMTFYGWDDEVHCTSYAMTQVPQIQETNFLGLIFTFAEDFGHYSYSD